MSSAIPSSPKTNYQDNYISVSGERTEGTVREDASQKITILADNSNAKVDRVTRAAAEQFQYRESWCREEWICESCKDSECYVWGPAYRVSRFCCTAMIITSVVILGGFAWAIYVGSK